MYCASLNWQMTASSSSSPFPPCVLASECDKEHEIGRLKVRDSLHNSTWVYIYVSIHERMKFVWLICNKMYVSVNLYVAWAIVNQRFLISFVSWEMQELTCQESCFPRYIYIYIKMLCFSSYSLILVWIMCYAFCAIVGFIDLGSKNNRFLYTFIFLHSKEHDFPWL